MSGPGRSSETVRAAEGDANSGGRIHRLSITRERPLLCASSETVFYALSLAVPGVSRSPALVRQAETGQRHARKAGAEFLQRRAARYGLSQTLCQFILLSIAPLRLG